MMERLLTIYSNGFYSFTAVLVLALVLDLLIGDPERFPHPVRLIGRAVSFIEGLLRRPPLSPSMEKALGAVLALSVVVPSYALTAALLYLAKSVSPLLHFFLSVFFVWAFVSIRSLKEEAEGVVLSLEEEGIERARERLSRIVGRDTKKLSHEEVLRATSETVAENTSDAVVAPLFYLALGGPALMAAYKAVNTLDSMVGYRNSRYLRFGAFSARLDDALNFIPSRLTALLMVASSLILGYDWKGSARVLMRDGGNHPSPNSGRPEAAVAGALGVRFGGPASYGGVESLKPYIGDSARAHTAESVFSSVRIMLLTSLLMAALTALCRYLAIFLL